MLAVFIGLIVFTGVYPKPMLDRIEPSVDALIEHVEARTDFGRAAAASRRRRDETGRRRSEGGG